MPDEDLGHSAGPGCGYGRDGVVSIQMMMPSLNRRARPWHVATWLLVALAFDTAQAFAQSVDIIPSLRAGDAFQLEVIRIRENSAQPQQNNRGRTLIDVRVISASTEGFVIEWVPGATILNNPLAAQNPLLGVDSQALRDIRFRLNLSADGELQGMANQAEVAPKLKTVVDAIVRDLSVKIPEAQRKAFLDFVGQILSVDLLIASATRDAATYFGLNGATLSAGDEVEVDLEQPNPLGGEPIPASLYVRMDSATADSASLKTKTTYDATSLMRLTESLAKRAGAPIPPEELAKLPAIEMADEGTYIFDRKVGLMREVKVNRRVGVGPNRRLDAWEIRLLSGPR